MFGQFTGEEKPDGGLNFPGSNGRIFDLCPEIEKIKFVKLSRCTMRRPLDVTKSPTFNWPSSIRIKVLNRESYH